jgi:hypothetical protein
MILQNLGTVSESYKAKITIQASKICDPNLKSRIDLFVPYGKNFP